jgi:hypothetical protein
VLLISGSKTRLDEPQKRTSTMSFLSPATNVVHLQTGLGGPEDERGGPIHNSTTQQTMSIDECTKQSCYSRKETKTTERESKTIEMEITMTGKALR